MCGLVGILDLRDLRPVDGPLLERMTGTLVHRGPDSSGQFVDGPLGFGFRRLSILDLAGGDQPMFNEDRSIVSVCNGEIFNYRELREWLGKRGHTFYTRTDVEVLVHLYEEEGEDLLDRLSGQFAFALYDRRARRLLLARDQVGINPLHYAVADGWLIFGSEIKALLAHPAVPREVDLTGLDQLLTFPGTVSPRTLFRGIQSLPAGWKLTAHGSDVRTREYWDLDYPVEPAEAIAAPARSEADYAEELRELLTRSVERRLQADVPVGFYLSGGMDSSLIAALIREVSPDVTRHSFSIAFNDKEICESKYQRLMAGHAGSQHHEIVFDWSAIADRLPAMVYHCECPVKETFNTCSLALSEAVREAGVKVVLAGEGADELFAGYMGYRFDQLGLRAATPATGLEAALEEELREQLWGDPSLFYEQDFLPLRELKSAFYAEPLAESLDEFEAVHWSPVNKDRLHGRHYVHQRSYLDFKLRLSDHLLSEHGDRMVLAHSVEGRYPFLDLDVIEFARRLPPHLKINQFVEKYIVRKVAADLLPRPIVEREKFGFRAPGSPYLLRQDVDWINDLLSAERIRRQGYFNPEAIERLKRQHARNGHRLNAHLEIDLLMIALTFGIFLDQFDLPSRG
jgi:asparagine synthase (glutamine-hydrolysing)